MRKFSDNQHLMNYIKSNNISDLKEELLNTIFFLKGDKEEMNLAIEYAITNSDFQFDNHIEIRLDNNSSLEDQYTDETINMKQNFSEERLKHLLELYELFYAKHEIAPLVEEKGEFYKINVKKVAVVTIGIIVAGYLMYKIFD